MSAYKACMQNFDHAHKFGNHALLSLKCIAKLLGAVVEARVVTADFVLRGL